MDNWCNYEFIDWDPKATHDDKEEVQGDYWEKESTYAKEKWI